MTASPKPRFDPDGDPARPPFVAYLCDEVTAVTLARIATDAGWPKEAVRLGGLAGAHADLGSTPTPKLLVVDVSEADDPVQGILKLADVCDPETRVITLGAINDVELFRRLRAAGVDDYLPKPVRAETLEQSIASAIGADAPEGAKDRGRMIAVIGARGGIGATTIAVNTAWLLAHERERRIALVDLDLNFGTTGLTLDLEPGPGLREALDDPGRIDELFIERAMIKADERLFVLGAEEALGGRLEPNPAGAEMLVDALSDAFEGVIVDLPRELALKFPALVGVASTLVVVTDLSLAGMRDALRLVAYLREAGAKARLILVANRVGEFKKAEVPRRDFEANGEVRLDFLVPYDPKAAVEASLKGRALAEVARRSRIGKTLRALSAELSGKPASTAGKRRWWRPKGR